MTPSRSSGRALEDGERRLLNSGQMHDEVALLPASPE